MEAVIKVEGLCKDFGAVNAVKGIDFEVKKGELFGFLGINGAGKSTTINMLCTVLKPTAGNVHICGMQLGKSDDEIRKKIGVVYQNNCLDERLTVKENLFIRGALYENNQKKLSEDVARVCEVLQLEEVYNRRFGKLSGGWKRRCEIAAALMHTPEILFLDEPTTGLDPATRKDVWSVIESLRRNTGMTIFLTTHYMEEAAGANRIIIIDKGSVRAQGTPFELKEKYASDTVKIYCSKENGDKNFQTLSDQGFSVKKEEYGLSFPIKNTVDAIEPVHSLKEQITGFEVIQGNMDDVFLNACSN